MIKFGKDMPVAELLAAMDAADTPPEQEYNFQKKRKKRLMPSAFPDYARSIVTQSQGDPETSGYIRGAGYGLAGAAVTGALSRLSEQDWQRTAIAAVLGGLLTGGAGYYSGKREQESHNSKLLALRRMGIDRPGELEAIENYPGLARYLTAQGVKV